MKKRKIKVLYVLLTVTAALLIALTGTFVPELLLDAKAAKLATGTGEVDNGDVSPYTYTMDTQTRITKMEKMVEQMSVLGGDLYMNVREPLDTELSREQAKKRIQKFLTAYTDILEEKGLLDTVESNMTDAPGVQVATDQGAGRDVQEENGYIYIEEPDFLVSPEDKQLSGWLGSGYIYNQFVEIIIDAVSGLPVMTELGLVRMEPDETCCMAAAEAYEKAYGEDLKFGTPQAMDVPQAGEMMRQSGNTAYEYAYGFSCTTQDSALRLEYQYYGGNTGYAKSKKYLDVYGEVFIWLYEE